MDKKYLKYFQEYKISSEVEVKIILQKLSDLGENYFAVSDEVEEIKKKAGLIFDFFSSLSDSLMPYELNVLLMLDISSCQKFIDLLKENKGVGNSEVFQEIMKDVYQQIETIFQVLGLGAYSSVYSLQEIEEFFSNKEKDFDYQRMYRSLSEYIRNEDNGELTRIILNILQKNNLFFNDRRLFDWQDSILYHLLLHLFFSRFENRLEEQQLFLIEFYIYDALVAGVDIVQALSNALYNTRNVVDYVNKNRKFYESLQMNTELVLKNDKNDGVLTLGYILGTFSLFYSDNYNDLNVLDKFCLIIEGEGEKVEKYRSWLKKILNLFIHLNKLDLIEKNKGDELDNHDLWQNDMLSLVANFGIGKDGVEYIVKYFKNDKRLVSLNAFLNKLKMIGNLNDPIFIENVNEVGSYLAEFGLLDLGKDLIYFSEIDNQFYWNEELLK